MAHVAEWKYDEVKEITDVLTNNKVVGVLNIGGIPAPQMQHMRKKFHGNAFIRSSKNTLIKRAIDDAEKKVKGLSDLKELLDGQSAIIATDMNPFKLYNQIKQSRTMAPARGGETADHDIEVKKGDTPFKPGPIVGDLQKVGIPAAIQQGKVVIKKDKVLVKKGDKISPEVAQMLTRLEIHPIEIGLTLNGVYEDGNIFKPDILDIDVDEFIGKIKNASGNSFTLALELGWVNSQTVQPLLMKAYRDAFNISLEQGIPTKNNVEHLVSKAHRQMNALKDISDKKKKENN